MCPKSLTKLDKKRFFFLLDLSNFISRTPNLRFVLSLFAALLSLSLNLIFSLWLVSHDQGVRSTGVSICEIATPTTTLSGCLLLPDPQTS